jgi:hypothetical protein
MLFLTPRCAKRLWQSVNRRFTRPHLFGSLTSRWAWPVFQGRFEFFQGQRAALIGIGLIKCAF